MSKLVLIAALLAAVALAQPAVNAPLLPQYNYIEGSGKDAVVGVTMAGEYGFTADSAGVWAMNMSMPSNVQAPFWDPLPGVTTMWAWCGNWTNASSCHVYAIAGPVFAMYRMNNTAIWRAATQWTKNATFNIIAQSTPSHAYPTILPNADASGWNIFLGTQNTSNVPSGTFLPSTVYAFDAMTLNVVWATVVNSDTTNFQTANCSQFLWIMTQNQTGFNSDTIVRKLYPNNGTMIDWWYDTQLTNSIQTLGVMGGQFMVLSSGGYTSFAWYNGSRINYYSIPTSCSTMPYAPILLNNTWYAICSGYVVMYDATTLVRSYFYTSSNIRCGAIHEWNQDFVIVAGQNVYVGNESGIGLLATLPDPVSGSYSQCSGAQFNYISPRFAAMWSNITDIVHISFTSSYSGSVIAMNYRSGAVLAQAASNVAPIGPAIVDYMDRRLYVASTQGNILQGYEFVPRFNVTSYVADVSNSGSSATVMSVAYNATNRSTYYISTYDLHTIDYMGNTVQLATYSYTYSSVQPLIVGQYLVFFDSYNDNVRIYDSVKKTLVSVSVDEIDTTVQPVAFGTKVVVFNPYSSTVAVVVDVSAATPAAAAITADNGRIVNGATVVGTTLIINTGYSTVAGFDFTKSTYTTSTWKLTQTANSIYSIQSAPVAYNSLAYFVAMSYTIGAGATYTNNVFSVTASGSMSKVGQLLTQVSAERKVLSIKSGGVFGGAVMYIIGSQNVTAYTTSWSMLFNYKSNQTILVSGYPLTPVVLNTGAICFYTTYAFTVVGGFKGGLAWYYNTTSTYYPALTDNTTIFFTDGQYVIGADTYTGAVTSLSTYGSSNLRGFAVAAGPNSTTVIGATDNEVVFANQVLSLAGPMTNFPGSGSAPGGGSFGEPEKSKIWIVGVAVGVLVVIAVVVFIVKRGGAPKNDDNYVPMNPATQV